jgi:hypothetical protein
VASIFRKKEDEQIEQEADYGVGEAHDHDRGIMAI